MAEVGAGEHVAAVPGLRPGPHWAIIIRDGEPVLTVRVVAKHPDELPSETHFRTRMPQQDRVSNATFTLGTLHSKPPDHSA